MSPARTVFAALALTAFLACEPVLEPEVSVAVSSLAFSDSGDDDDDVANAEADLDELNDSGIEGEIEFTDDGGTLTIVGEADGMDPDGFYVSLIYDNASVATGPDACEPAIFNPADPDFLLPTMLIGFWSVDEDGEGTLVATNTNFGADYVPLNKFRTISIRDTSIDDGFGPLAVAACGVVETDDDDDDDN